MYVSLYLCISVYMHREREKKKKNTLWSSGERSYQPVSRLAHGLTKTEALLGAQLRHSAFRRATWRLHTFGDGVAWENDQIFTNLIELSEWLVHMTFSMQTAHIPKANRDSRGRRSRPPKLGRCIPARCHPWSILKPGHFGHMGMVIIFTMLCRLCRGMGLFCLKLRWGKAIQGDYIYVSTRWIRDLDSASIVLWVLQSVWTKIRCKSCCFQLGNLGLWEAELELKSPHLCWILLAKSHPKKSRKILEHPPIFRGSTGVQGIRKLVETRQAGALAPARKL